MYGVAQPDERLGPAIMQKVIYDARHFVRPQIPIRIVWIPLSLIFIVIMDDYINRPDMFRILLIIFAEIIVCRHLVLRIGKIVPCPYYIFRRLGTERPSRLLVLFG